MQISPSFDLLHLSLSRLVVSDVPRRMPTWAPIEFYAAIEAMDSPEDCMGHIKTGTTVLTGWRLFSDTVQAGYGNIVQKVHGAERLVIRGEAIAYARTAAREKFLVTGELENWAEYEAIHPELYDLLGRYA